MKLGEIARKQGQWTVQVDKSLVFMQLFQQLRIGHLLEGRYWARFSGYRGAENRWSPGSSIATDGRSHRLDQEFTVQWICAMRREMEGAKRGSSIPYCLWRRAFQKNWCLNWELKGEQEITRWYETSWQNNIWKGQLYCCRRRNISYSGWQNQWKRSKIKKKVVRLFSEP